MLDNIIEFSPRLQCQRFSPPNNTAETDIPGPATFSGRTREPAPMVFPVMSNAVAMTALKSSKTDGIGREMSLLGDPIATAFREESCSLVLLVDTEVPSLGND
mmetsp:Transcript_11375/g.26400  ORF Transcript_11375/g.26400 Transcript_11375/m.26400 type:complete len:103 (+) Transcript_11375:1250-1558(+)